MKVLRICVMLTLGALAQLATPTLLGQGATTPAGPPAPSMKSLQEIWNRIGQLETKVAEQNELIESQSDKLFGVMASQQMNLPWQLEVVDGASADVGQFASLAFAKDGQPAISYFDTTNGDLKFAKFNGTTWEISVIASDGLVGRNCDLAFSPSGEAFVVYEGFNFTLMVAHRTGSEPWVLDLVGGAGVAKEPSVAFLPDGRPVIAFIENGTGLAVASLIEGEVWDVARVTPPAPPAGPVICVSKARGQVLVGYRGGSNLQLATRPMGGGSLSLETWLTDLPTQTFFDMTLSPSGQPSVSYLRSAPNEQRFASMGDSLPPALVIKNGAAGGLPGVSIAYSRLGQACTAYQYRPEFFLDDDVQLGFAFYNGSAWVHTTVDPADNLVVGRYASLAIGPNGLPAIAYYDETNGNLKFAHMGVFGE